MIKLIGAGMVIITCGLIGTLLGKNITKHVEEIRQFQFGLQTLETEIMYTLTPLPQALKAAESQTKGTPAKFFQEVGQRLKDGQGQTVGEIWSESLKKLTPYSLLTTEELSYLEQFGQGLGSSDREDQLKRLTRIKNYLLHREKEVETERSQFQKVWQTLGWSCGLVITLIFI
ncbi:hypothetical protein NVS47_10640 [Dehalobacterium formicoaceticum]|uniref:Stage III sporulation protein AB n=1 Tax=Dehalobacterium formicoaceticum TaxID=51515 RepID=A0ABT1Y7U9_9FIRM|nr:hypothetical protein [Dehalobacterium formicoaceticum]MCR6545964.1 hypothetical protein [Dehalobacterium formicoaceticum]